MQNRLAVLLTIAVTVWACGSMASTGNDAPQPQVTPTQPTQGKLQIEIHPISTDLVSTGEEVSVDIEGIASAIGGVRFLDIMMVLDTSMSLRSSDPNDYRSTGAVGLIKHLSPKSDAQIGVVGFDDNSELTQPLTSDRDVVVQALQDLKRAGGTNIAAGIRTALDELERNGRPGSSRVILLFTDGMSSKNKAVEASREAQSQGVAIQTLLLGENLKGARILDEIASTTGGSFVWVTDPEKLPDAFLNLRTTGVDNVTLSVNGSQPIPTQLTGGTFTANVPLKLGENRIVAVATSLDEQTKQSMVTINVGDASCAALEVSALNEGQPALSLNERAVEIVVDASRSMWGQIQGKAKMTIAKEILQDASHWLPSDLNLAVRAYGNASPADANDCSDSALLVPFGNGNREPIREAISNIRPSGQTPIAYALDQAAGDFASLASERALVLVTDGIESCGGDPVASARELRKQGIMIHLIGFGLDNSVDGDAASLQAIANATGGHFVTANSADELKKALEVTVGTRFRVMRQATVVADSVLGANEPLFLPKGDYRVEFDSVPPHEVQISLAPSDELMLTLQKHGGVVSHSERRDRLPPTSCADAIAANKTVALELAADGRRGTPSYASRHGQ